MKICGKLNDFENSYRFRNKNRGHPCGRGSGEKVLRIHQYRNGRRDQRLHRCGSISGLRYHQAVQGLQEGASQLEKAVQEGTQAQLFI